MKIIGVNPENVIKTGFFCKMSQKKTDGYQRKLRWLKARFTEGLKIKMLDLSEGGRGFIEYLPGEFAWRAVRAEGYMFIHCLWVVGASKGKGYAGLLLEECMKDARKQGLRGVAMVTSEGNWLISKKLLLGHGFQSVDEAAPSFELLVNKFDGGPAPSFPADWEARAKRFGEGLTIIRSDQCPYLGDAVNFATETAREKGMSARVVELTSAREIQERAPSPYGVFTVLLNGQILTHHYLLKKELLLKLQ
ncbi:MAG: GNAT family N-acetyltransferase [Acidobacteria bacterium]|nr:MAG: GNAT family N-acetyltransferase [Acidobacteriota bacterium]